MFFTVCLYVFSSLDIEFFVRSGLKAIIRLFQLVLFPTNLNMKIFCIQMIKLCGNSICKTLTKIFNDCLNKGKFPHGWKKVKVVSIQKKGNKQSLKNYRQLYSLYAAKFLSISFVTKCLPFLLRTI